MEKEKLRKLQWKHLTSLQYRCHPCSTLQTRTTCLGFKPAGRKPALNLAYRKAVPEALICMTSAQSWFVLMWWRAQAEQSLISLQKTMHTFHLRQEVCSKEGILWAHFPDLRYCMKSLTLLCFSFQHKHMDSGKLYKELYFPS